MDDTQPPRLALTSRLKRFIVAGVLSTVVCCLLTGAKYMLLLIVPNESGWHWIWWWAFGGLILMLSTPQFAFDLLGGGIINPHLRNVGETLLLIGANLLLWFSLGAISASTFRRKKLAALIWIVLVGTVEILGTIIAIIIFGRLQL